MTKQDFIHKITIDGINMNMSEMVALIENGDISIETVFHIVTENIDPQSWFACWILNHYADNHPSVAEPYLDEIVLLLPQVSRTGLLRLLLRLVILAPNWKIEKLGLLLDFCLNTLTNMSIPVGVKANAMSIIDRIAETEPDIREEALLIIEEQVPYLSAGGLSKAKKILKKYRTE